MALLSQLSPLSRIFFASLLIISTFSLISALGILLAVPLFGISLYDTMNLLADPVEPGTRALLRYLQSVQTAGLFILPALLAGFLFSGNAPAYLQLNRRAKAWSFILTIALLVVSVPLIQGIITLNEQMKLPYALAGLEQWMRETEDQAAALTDMFLEGITLSDLLVNLLVVAVLPGIGEELMFRGLVQRLFADWLGSMHAAIWISAILFGAMHLQFYGIFPRILLGALLGYMFWWSGSLWIPVFAHFLNNAYSVVMAWLASNGWITGDWEMSGRTSDPLILSFSFLLTIFCIFLFFRSRVNSLPIRQP